VSLLFLSGLFAGFSMFMKNEGIFFIIMLSLIFFIFPKVTKQRWYAWKDYWLFLLGVVTFVVINLVMRIWINPPIHPTAATHVNYIANFFSLSRHITALQAFIYIGQIFGQFEISIWLLLFFLLLLARYNISRIDLYRVLTILAQIILMLLGYYAIYVILSPNMEWHIRSSLDRLYLQLWPCFLLFFFLLIDSPLQDAEDNYQYNNKKQNIRYPTKKEKSQQ
jgi:hypothetical protein